MRAWDRRYAGILLTVFLWSAASAHAEIGAHLLSLPSVRDRWSAVSNDSPLGCSAVSLVLPGIANPNASFPTTIPELMTQLGRYGSANAALVPFSRAPGATSLGRPRVLITLTPPDGQQGPQGRRDLNDRIFMGVTTAPDGAQTLEFISWNRRRRAFDFGVVENFNRPSERRLIMNAAKTRECLQCHKTGGPIFPNFPWSGTAADPLMAAAMLENAFHRDPARYGSAYQGLQALRQRTGNSSERLLEELARARTGGPLPLDVQAVFGATLRLDGEETGIPFFERGQFDRTANIDGAVRNAARSVLLPQQVVAGLPIRQRAAYVRSVTARSLVVPFKSSAPPSQEALESMHAYALAQRTQVRTQLAGALPDGEILSGSHTSQLVDFDPVAGAASPQRTTASHASFGELGSVHAHSLSRDNGTFALPAGFRPSTSAAFLFDKNPPSLTLRQAVAGDFDPTLGLSRRDAEPILGLAAAAAPTAPETQAAILRAALESPAFTATAERGLISREVLLPLLFREVEREIVRRGLTPDRRFSVANLVPEAPDRCEDDAPAAEASAPAAHRGLCVECHSGTNVGGALRFAFDPQDRAQWESRLSAPETRESTRRYLGRVLRRLTDRDMPPEDSAEGRRLRDDPERARELEALRAFLTRLRDENRP